MKEETIQPAPAKVRITKCSFSAGWYKSLIGEVFEVDNASPPKDYVLWEDYINRNHIWRHIAQEDCERIETTVAPPPQSEGELWMKIFASVMRTNAMVSLKMATGDWEGVKELTETAIVDLSKVYDLGLRSDKPELFTKEQVAQLIREAFIEGFRNNGVPLGEWSDNLEGNEEQLKEFINSKLQPGVKG